MRIRSRLITFAAACAATLAVAPGAFADDVVSASVPAGGTITTGTAVSGTDPVQLTLHVLNGGTVTIRKIDAAAAGDSRDRSIAFGPSFEVTGDATLDGADFLIQGNELPASGRSRLNERHDSLSVACRQENTNGLTAMQACGSEIFSTTEDGAVTPSGDVRVTLFKPGQGNDHQWDLGRHGNAGAGNVSLRLSRLAFDAFVSNLGGDLRSLDDLERKRSFPASLECVYVCSITYKVFVSPKVKRALRLSSATVASGKPRPGPSGKLYDPKTKLPIKASFLSALKKKGVSAITLHYTWEVRGPNGEREATKRPGAVYLESSAGRFRVSCSVRGISSEELRVLAPKGRTVCK
jgi:hypothetical protein